MHFAVIFQLNRLGWQNPLHALTEDPLLNFGARYLLVAIITVGLASLTYRLVERPGIRLGSALIRQFPTGRKSDIRHQ